MSRRIRRSESTPETPQAKRLRREKVPRTEGSLPESVVPSIDEQTTKNVVQNSVRFFNGVEVPKFGIKVDRRIIRRAGVYVLGPKLAHSPAVDSVVQHLARKDKTDQFYQLKILSLDDNPATDKAAQDERQGKMLIHNEFSLLSILENEIGVVHHHGLFSDEALEEKELPDICPEKVYTGKIIKRLVLVLDCTTAHDFSEKSAELINLNQYIKDKKQLLESEALHIFYQIIRVVERLHQKNIVHRDLKTTNIVFNRRTNKIVITNFSLGKQLISESELLSDKIGTPAYCSPDVLSKQPYRGKASEMWALGIALFAMLYGKFPFYERTTPELFKKIKIGEYNTPEDIKISTETKTLIKNILNLNATDRLTATEVREQLESMFAVKILLQNDVDQVVPERGNEEKEKDTFKNSPSKILSKIPFSTLLTTNAVSPTTRNAIRRSECFLFQRIDGPEVRHITQNELQYLMNQNSTEPTEQNQTNTTPNNRNLFGRYFMSSGYLNINQQMSNLTIRNQERRRNMSWHDVRNYSAAANRSPPESVTRRRYTPRLLAIVPLSGNRQRTQSESSNTNNNNNSALNDMNLSYGVRVLTHLLNEAFIQGRIPTTHTSLLREFRGVVTLDLARKIVEWLQRDFASAGIIAELFGTSEISNYEEKVLTLFRCFGVQMDVDANGETKIKTDQTLELLMILTYFLQAAGYNNSYFIRLLE